MGLAVRTLGFKASNPGATVTAATAATGDSLTLPTFAAGSRAFMTEIIRGGATAGLVRVRSPLLHDDVTGLTFYTDVTPTIYSLAPEVGQPVQPADNLIVELTGGTAETDVALVQLWMENLPGSNANLVQWADIASHIEQCKGLTVAVTTNGTAGTWTDTAINTTDKQLKAQRYYAVLGYSTDSAIAGIGVYGPATGNQRVAGPGSDKTQDTIHYFIERANKHNLPFIPVINGSDAGATNVSTFHNAASATPNITLNLALLDSSYQPAS